MLTTAESKMIRRLAHKMLDDLLDTAEALLECLGEEWNEDLERPTRERSTAVPSVALAGNGKPRITLAEKPEVPAAVERGRPDRRPQGEVVIGCRRVTGTTNAIHVVISRVLATRIGLGPRFPCSCKITLTEHKLLLGPGEGLRAKQLPGGNRVLIRLGVMAGYVVAHEHPSEVCAYHLNPEGRLVIRAPAWLKRATPAAPPARPTGKQAEGDPGTSCKPLRGTNPVIKCAACQKVPATVECSRCPTLLCDGCWESHVRAHWHSALTGRVPAVHAT